jgi:hypothetical protein
MAIGTSLTARTLIDRCDAIDWRAPAFDPARILADYQSWLKQFGLALPVRLVRDPAETSIWTPREPRYAPAALPGADRWVARAFSRTIAWELALLRAVNDCASVDAPVLGRALSVSASSWDIAAGWASVMSQVGDGISEADTLLESWSQDVDVRKRVILWALALLCPFGPWTPPPFVTSVLRTILAASAHPCAWDLLVNVGTFRARTLLGDAAVADVNPGLAGPDEIVADLMAFCEPMIAACESGAFVHAATDGDLIVLASPSIRTDGRRLHCVDGPAIAWPRTGIYAWRGIFVEAHALMNPSTITREAVRKANGNTRLTRALIDIRLHANGGRRCMRDLGGILINEDSCGRLWCVSLSGRPPRAAGGSEFKLAEVTNGTEERDGSRKTYWLWVPPDVRTAHEAVAWSYGLTSDQYNALAVRT